MANGSLQRFVSSATQRFMGSCAQRLFAVEPAARLTYVLQAQAGRPCVASPLGPARPYTTATWPAATMSMTQCVSRLAARTLQPAAGPHAVPVPAEAAQGLLAYQLEQGTLAKWCTQDGDHSPPTAVLVHGILGSKRNLQSFTRRLLQEHPAWQVLLIDLRSHGDSTHTPSVGPSSVDSAALDILRLLRHLRMFPTMLVGHSFGGKVVLSMVEQFGQNLPKPVTAWVLDTVPGPVHAGAGPDGAADHPRDLIQTLLKMPTPIHSRSHVIETLEAAGFSAPVAKWVSTNLRRSARAGLAWGFDLPAIADMYDSYECKSHWPLLERPPTGLRVKFVKAEQSSFRWRHGDAERIVALGHEVHTLPDSGHWVHTDNPEGLLDIMALAFGGPDEVRRIHAAHSAAEEARGV